MTFEQWASDRLIPRVGTMCYDLAKAAWDAARQAERERCAKVCEEKGESFTIHNFTIPATGNSAAKICAKAIENLKDTP